MKKTTATILNFVPRRVQPGRISARDHAEINSWIISSSYDHLAFEASADLDNPDLGDFFLIYGPHATWSSWGVGRTGAGFIVWEAVTTETLGWYDDMTTALSAIPPAPAARQGRLRRGRTRQGDHRPGASAGPVVVAIPRLRVIAKTLPECQAG